MLTHIRTEADLDAALAALEQSRSAIHRAHGDGRAAAAAAAARRLCRPCRDGRVAAALDRQRRRDLGPARRGLRSVRAGSHHQGARRQSWRGIGLSRPKIKALKEIARAVARGEPRSRRSPTSLPTTAHAALTAVHGIGPWTADIYLLACLGHADAWPAGDLALQEAARLAFGLAARPTRKEMVPLAEPGGRGAPWRRACYGPIIAPSKAAKARRSCRRSCQKSSTKRQKKGSKRPLNWRLNLMDRGSAPRSGAAQQLVVFLHGYGADGNDLIDIGRAWQQYLPQAAFVSPHAPEPCGQAPVGRQWFALTFRDPNERWIGVNKAAPLLEALSRRRAGAPQVAAVGAGAGRLQPGHHDGAACRAAPRRRAGGDRRLFRPPGGAARRQPRGLRRRDQIAAAGAAGSRRPRRSHPAAGFVPGHAGRLPRSRCRSNGTSRPASAMASTPRACAMAASSWPGDLA